MTSAGERAPPFVPRAIREALCNHAWVVLAAWKCTRKPRRPGHFDNHVCILHVLFTILAQELNRRDCN